MPKKAYVTVGTFDCFGQQDHHLVTQMQKFAAGKGNEYVIIRSDYQAWLYDRVFPSQLVLERRFNVSLFTKYAMMGQLRMEDEKDLFMRFIQNTREELGINEIIYVIQDTQRNFPCRELCRKHKIPVKFIHYKDNVSKTK